MLPTNIIYLAIPVTLIGYFFYFKNIFYGTTRPNLVSWILWMLGPFLGVFFQIKAGAGLAALPVFIAGFGPLILIITSLLRKNIFWKVTPLDVVCGILAILALVFYVLTHNLEISIFFAILTDTLASVPTLVKTWKFPETESVAGYVPSIFNATLSLLIIKNWIFSIYSFSIYLILVNITIVSLIYRKKIFKS